MSRRPAAKIPSYHPGIVDTQLLIERRVVGVYDILKEQGDCGRGPRGPSQHPSRQDANRQSKTTS
jgi:hypothetical protein